jgi:hypothetical protein
MFWFLAKREIPQAAERQNNLFVKIDCLTNTCNDKKVKVSNNNFNYARINPCPTRFQSFTLLLLSTINYELLTNTVF